MYFLYVMQKDSWVIWFDSL